MYLSYLPEAAFKRNVLKMANETYLLADSSKFGSNNLVSYAHVTQIDHIITDVSLFLLVVSSYLVYRTNGNTSTLVEKWQQKYGFEVRKDNLLVEKKTKPVVEKRKIYNYAESPEHKNHDYTNNQKQSNLAPDSIWLWTAFILALRDLVVNLTSVFYYPINDPNPLAGLD